MKRAWRKTRPMDVKIAVATLTIAGFTGAGIACVVPDTTRVTTVLAPDEAEYTQYVDPYLARRCATLDCHGQIGRPLRLYSQNGLRLADAGVYDPINTTGDHGSATTAAEKHANYESIIGLQPEVMSQVIGELGHDPERLLLLEKPLLVIPHKGGPVMARTGDPGYACVTEWLAGGQIAMAQYNFAGDCQSAFNAAP